MLEAETARMMKAYGNHPSYLLLSPTNEPAGAWTRYLPQWTAEWYAKDPRRLYSENTGRVNLDGHRPDFRHQPDSRRARMVRRRLFEPACKTYTSPCSVTKSANGARIRILMSSKSSPAIFARATTRSSGIPLSAHGVLDRDKEFCARPAANSRSPATSRRSKRICAPRACPAINCSTCTIISGKAPR